MVVMASLSLATICGGGLHGAMAKLEREITIVVVVRGGYGLLEITMIF